MGKLVSFETLNLRSLGSIQMEISSRLVTLCLEPQGECNLELSRWSGSGDPWHIGGSRSWFGVGCEGDCSERVLREWTKQLQGTSTWGERREGGGGAQQGGGDGNCLQHSGEWKTNVATGFSN